MAGDFQNLGALLINGAEIHPAPDAAPVYFGQLCLFQQTFLHQGVQIDEIVVAGEGREGLVGGVAEARGGQGQDLPAALSGFLQEVHEPVGLFAHGADAIGAGQGGNVHQNTAFTHSYVSFVSEIERMLSRFCIRKGTVSCRGGRSFSIQSSRIWMLRSAMVLKSCLTVDS